MEQNFQLRKKGETSTVSTVLEVDGTKQVCQADISIKHTQKSITIDVKIGFSTKHISFDSNEQVAAKNGICALVEEAYDVAVQQLSDAMDLKEKQQGLQDLFAQPSGVSDWDGQNVGAQ